ncbi:MAG: hypothetical protein CM1200mP40_18740 [Gammaproteobacteria bacterium]|nr:MAG: hypothetical protein CM1200mP40_18740 [Gammaproteobacteria bacterium]
MVLVDLLRKGRSRLYCAMPDRGQNVAPHLSFGGTDDDEVRASLTTYREAGINRLVALRGDLPSRASIHHRYASELVEFIRNESGDHFSY